MATIALSAGVRQALSSLQSTSAQQSAIQNRLATGKKVNSALDNPTSFFTASGLSNRASDLTNLLDDMGQAVKTLEAADKAITSIGKLVDNAKSIAKQAQAAPADVAASGGTTTGTVDTSGSWTAGAGADAKVIKLKVDGVDKTVTLATADNQAAIITKFATAGLTAADDGSGKLKIAAPVGKSFSIEADSDAAALSAIGVSAGTYSNTEASTKRADLQKDLDGILEQIDQMVSDASYNGVNLIQGDNLKVAFNESGKSKLDIEGVNLKSDGLGVDSLSLDTSANIDTALTKLKSATDTLRSQSATFGANLSVVQNRQDFTKGMVDTLNNGSDQLTLADPNEEGAKLLSLNTRAQLSGTALSLASQQDQAVLKLF